MHMETQETQGKVIFRTKYLRFQLHVAPERKEIVGGEVLLTPAKVIPFDTRGEFRTSDPAEIEQVRRAIQKKRDKYGEQDVFEVTQDDILNVQVAEEALRIAKERLARGTVRGAVTSKTLAGEPSGPDEEEPLTPIEKTKANFSSTCDVCGKTFEDDPQGKRVKAHKRIKHKPADGEDATEE